MDVTYKTTSIAIVIKGPNSRIVFQIINSHFYCIIFGISWLEKYNPNIG